MNGSLKKSVGPETADNGTRGGSSPNKPALRIRLLVGILVLAAGYWGYTVLSKGEAYWSALSQSVNLSGSASQARAQQPTSTFQMQPLSIPRKQILSGGPPKDGIPAISDPKFIDAANAKYLKPDDRVIGVATETATRAYPLKILNYHEVINDKIGEVPVAVTYCPLCDSSVVFDRRTPLGTKEFGVSGLLYNSNVLMYDRTRGSEKLWSQMMASGVSGEAAGEELQTFPFEVTTWREWRERHPETQVLSSKTGFPRDYSRNPYQGYFQSDELMFPVDHVDKRLPKKARVLGVWNDEQAIAFPLDHPDQWKSQTDWKLGSSTFRVEYDAEAESARLVSDSEELQSAYSFWFAWSAFHPDTKIAGQSPNSVP